MDAKAGLTRKQIELLTDLMVSKLSFISAVERNNSDPWLHEDTRPLGREEIKLVIVDTDILLLAEDVDAELERWASSG